MKKVVQFSDYLNHSEFSQGVTNAAKIASQGDTAKIAEPPGNKGSPAVSGASPLGKLGGKFKSSKKPLVKLSAHVKPATGPTPVPEGYKLDCAQMTPGQLHLAYPGEYQSWKDGKSRCKQKGWPWADEWKLFKNFLLSMGPKPFPTHTLDRIDNCIGAYGPDLCRWASKTVQNNNKSDNIKIVMPLTGEVFSAQKIANLHKVSVKTVYKWKASLYTDLEMIAGKKSKPLHALSVALDELVISHPPKSKKPQHRQIEVPAYTPPAFEDEWRPTDEEYDHYVETGIMRGTTRHAECRADYDALVAWIEGYNAGLPVSPQPPQGRYYKRKLPSNAVPPVPQPATAYCASDDCVDDVAEEDSDFDPTDCIDPND